METIKPGKYSTEFIATLLSLLVTVLVVFFKVPQFEAQDFADKFLATIPVVAAFLASALTVWKYISGRTELKVEALRANVQFKALTRE